MKFTPVLFAVFLTQCAGGPEITSTSLATAGCPTDVFLDVSRSSGPGAQFPDPDLSVSCSETTMTVRSNGLPHYTFVRVTPNPLSVADLTWELPLEPQLSGRQEAIPLLGVIGLAINGVPLFGPNEASIPIQEAWGDPIYNGIMDDCLGHTAFVYHYHALVQKCLDSESFVAEPWRNGDVDTGMASPVLGYANDGFAIYGRYGCSDAACTEVIEYKSSWTKVGDPMRDAWDAYQYGEQAGAEYLDRCNGHTGPDGTYHYHETASFPYIIGCYSGTPTS